jgi:hypothetical protein
MMSTAWPRSSCPHCGKQFDKVASLSPQLPVPQPGDFTICIQCAAILCFDQGLRVRELTPGRSRSPSIPARTVWRDRPDSGRDSQGPRGLELKKRMAENRISRPEMSAASSIGWCIRQRQLILVREAARLDDPQIKLALYDLLAEEILIRLEENIFDDAQSHAASA